MKDNLKKIQDLVYELEGLLHLSITREPCPPGIYHLVKAKIDEIHTLGDEIDPTKYVSADNDVSPDMEEIEYSGLDADSDIEESCEPVKEETIETGPEEHSALVLEEPIEQVVPEPIEPVLEEPIETAVEESDAEELMDMEMAGIDVPAEPGTEPKKENVEKRKPVFCINDRFRFRRTLFNGSDCEFNAAVDKISRFDNYDEAEKYFIGELGWEPESEDVSDFMELLKIYFE